MTKIRESLMDEITEEKKWNKRVSIILIVFISLMTIVTILFTFVFFHVSIVGPSMNPTLKNGDALIVNKLSEPEFGDIVIIQGKKTGGKLLIKRVIGVGGDTITIQDGYVFRNGEKLIEKSYLLVDGLTYYPVVNDSTNTEAHTWVIPENEYFFLGDNRRNSSDSRNDNYGTCEREQIIGVVSDNALKIKGITKIFNEISIAVKRIMGVNIYEGE